MVSQSGKKYRIRQGYSRNVDLLNDKGKPVKTYCAHPGEQLPTGGHRLAQVRCWHDDGHALLQAAHRSAPVHLDGAASMGG